MKNVTIKRNVKKFKDYWWKNSIEKSVEEDQQYITNITKSFDYIITKITKKYKHEQPIVDIIIIKKKGKPRKEFFKFKVTGRMLVCNPKTPEHQFIATYTHALRVHLTHK